MQRSDYWPEPTAHQEYWERHNCAYVYEYDPADDGPECEVIKAIFATSFAETLWDRAFHAVLDNPSDFDFGGF